jgi:uncharacterized cupredoxin-like copper-binding protein
MDMQRISRIAAALSITAASAFSPITLAHGSGHGDVAPEKHVKAEQTAFGTAGDPRRVSRSIDMDAFDSFRYSPDKLTVKRGETIRFVVHNKGTLQHEVVIGTMHALKEHAALMKNFPEMQHEAPNMLHVAPGQSSEIVWRFNRAGTFSFACLIAGHFEAGMVGTIVVI